MSFGRLEDPQETAIGEAEKLQWPQTEYTRRELESMDAILRDSAHESLAVLRRALAVAACEYVRMSARLRSRGNKSKAIGLETPENGIALMISWRMRAAAELEQCKAIAADLKAVRDGRA